MRDPEAGGVLLGRHIRDSMDVVVDFVTTPSTEDRRSRFRFWRAPKHHQEEINRAWTESEGTCVYLGEWHTHPQADPRPSATDLRDWRRKLREDSFVDPIFYLIVGTASIRAWQGCAGGDPEQIEEMVERGE